MVYLLLRPMKKAYFVRIALKNLLKRPRTVTEGSTKDDSEITLALKLCSRMITVLFCENFICYMFRKKEYIKIK